MINIDDLAEKFQNKINNSKENEIFKNDVAEPMANKIFLEKFSDIFKNITEALNKKLGINVVNFKSEGKTRFFVEGRYHRIIFQRGNINISKNEISMAIIPIFIWKGVTKHLNQISFSVKDDVKNIKWGVPFDSPEEYAKNLFGKLIDDKDFFI